VAEYAKEIAKLDVPDEKRGPKPRKGRAGRPTDEVQQAIQADTEAWQQFADRKVFIDQNADENLNDLEIAYWQKKLAATVQYSALWYAVIEHLNPLLVQQDEARVRSAQQSTEEIARLNEFLANQEKKFDEDVAHTIEQDVQREVEAHKKGTTEIEKAWKEANSEVLSAEGELVSGILSGRQNLGQLIENIALKTAEKEITADLQYWTERKLLQAEGIAAENAKETGGVLWHLLSANAKVAHTVVSQTAQTAATAIGVAARTAAESAGDIAGTAASDLASAGQITKDAGLAAAGVYAQVSQMPFGWIAAPVLAAAAFAGVESFSGLAQGTNYVPHDMIQQIHEGEAVLPKADNEALRAAVAGGNNGSGISFSFGDTHFHGVNGEPLDISQAFSDHADHLMNIIHNKTRSGWTSTAASPFKGG
jgi:hypothetical protein